MKYGFSADTFRVDNKITLVLSGGQASMSLTWENNEGGYLDLVYMLKNLNTVVKEAVADLKKK